MKRVILFVILAAFAATADAGVLRFTGAVCSKTASAIRHPVKSFRTARHATKVLVY